MSAGDEELRFSWAMWGEMELGTDIIVIRWKRNRHKDTERQKPQANMTDWMWVWRNNKR